MTCMFIPVRVVTFKQGTPFETSGSDWNIQPFTDTDNTPTFMLKHKTEGITKKVRIPLDIKFATAHHEEKLKLLKTAGKMLLANTLVERPDFVMVDSFKDHIKQKCLGNAAFVDPSKEHIARGFIVANDGTTIYYQATGEETAMVLGDWTEAILDDGAAENGMKWLHRLKGMAQDYERCAAEKEQEISKLEAEIADITKVAENGETFDLRNEAKERANVQKELLFQLNTELSAIKFFGQTGQDPTDFPSFNELSDAVKKQEAEQSSLKGCLIVLMVLAAIFFIVMSVR